MCKGAKYNYKGQEQSEGKRENYTTDLYFHRMSYIAIERGKLSPCDSLLKCPNRMDSCCVLLFSYKSH